MSQRIAQNHVQNLSISTNCCEVRPEACISCRHLPIATTFSVVWIILTAVIHSFLYRTYVHPTNLDMLLTDVAKRVEVYEPLQSSLFISIFYWIMKQLKLPLQHLHTHLAKIIMCEEALRVRSPHSAI